MAIIKTDDQHYKDIANAIREKLGSDDKYRPEDMAIGVQQACDVQYDNGVYTAYDEMRSKNAVPKIVTGTQLVTVSDVSEIPHNVSVQLSSDTITDFSNVTVTRLGKNWVDESKFYDAANWNINAYHEGANHHGFYKLHLGENTTYTISFDCADDFTSQWNLASYPKGTEPKYGEDQTIYYLSLSGTLTKKYTFTTEKGKDYGLFVSATYQKVFDVQYFLDNAVKWIQVEVGGRATSYETFCGETYGASEDGTVYDVTSTRQMMSIFTDAQDVTLTVGYNKSWGMQAVYDWFWDIAQNNGNRTDYQFAFGGKGWNDSTFKPKHSAQITAAREMFNGCNITNLKSILEMQNVTFDFSKCIDFTLFLSNSGITHFGVLDCTAIKNVSYLLYEAKKLVYLEKLIIAADGSQTFADQAFGGAIALKDIIIEGVFGSSVKMLQQPLSRASLESVVAALSTTATGQTLTVKKSAVEAAFTTEEWETLAATKPNWTITLYA